MKSLLCFIDGGWTAILTSSASHADAFKNLLNSVDQVRYCAKLLDVTTTRRAIRVTTRSNPELAHKKIFCIVYYYPRSGLAQLHIRLKFMSRGKKAFLPIASPKSETRLACTGINLGHHAIVAQDWKSNRFLRANRFIALLVIHAKVQTTMTVAVRGLLTWLLQLLSHIRNYSRTCCMFIA